MNIDKSLITPGLIWERILVPLRHLVTEHVV